MIIVFLSLITKQINVKILFSKFTCLESSPHTVAITVYPILVMAVHQGSARIHKA